MEGGAPIRAIVESMTAASHGWINVLSALLTPMIAIIAVLIAYNQYKINKLRLQHELYERRLHVYQAVKSFLLKILRDGDIDYHRCGQFYTDASEAAFLFDSEIQIYIDELYKNAVKMHALHERMYHFK